MERNTLLAVVLSAVVLFTYQAIFVAPKSDQILKTPSSPVELNHNSIQSPATSISPTISNSSQNILEKTVDYNFRTTNDIFSYTKVGGSLHNIDFVGNRPFPVSDILDVVGYENVPFQGQMLNNKTIALDYQDQIWHISKQYTLVDGNLIKARIQIKNISESSILNNFNFTALEIDQSRMEINSRDNPLYEYSVYSNGKIFRRGNATKFNDKNNKIESSNLDWVGFRDHYHAVLIKPEFGLKSYEIKADTSQLLTINITPQVKNLAPGESAFYDFNIYAGPQNPWLMKHYHMDFEKIVAFSNFPIIEWIGQAIYYTIPFLHQIFKSWGVSIILISLLIYGITYPLTMQSMISMRKMQEVQPKINALRERFKNDPQKLNAEMVEIYRREKINPFGGCLPFLIQMPFFMALYQILWRAQYFQGQSFLWIKDLSQPDRLIILPYYLPLFGNEFNILPVLTGGIMFLQQKISSKNMVVSDEQQVMQQKMMMYILPVMMTCMFYKFASSWAIYFLVFYILSTATQWKISQLSKNLKR